MLLQTNSYIVPKDRRAEHARLLRRFKQVLTRLGCELFEVYEQMGPNWTAGDGSGRFVQIMRFRDRKHQREVHAAEQSDPAAQQLIAEFCELVNLPYQQQQGLLAIGYYQGVMDVPAAVIQKVAEGPAATPPPPTARARKPDPKPRSAFGFGVPAAAAAAAAIPAGLGFGAGAAAPIEPEDEPAEEAPVDEAPVEEPAEPPADAEDEVLAESETLDEAAELPDFDVPEIAAPVVAATAAVVEPEESEELSGLDFADEPAMPAFAEAPAEPAPAVADPEDDAAAVLDGLDFSELSPAAEAPTDGLDALDLELPEESPADDFLPADESAAEDDTAAVEIPIEEDIATDEVATEETPTEEAVDLAAEFESPATEAGDLAFESAIDELTPSPIESDLQPAELQPEEATFDEVPPPLPAAVEEPAVNEQIEPTDAFAPVDLSATADAAADIVPEPLAADSSSDDWMSELDLPAATGEAEIPAEFQPPPIDPSIPTEAAASSEDWQPETVEPSSQIAPDTSSLEFASESASEVAPAAEFAVEPSAEAVDPSEGVFGLQSEPETELPVAEATPETLHRGDLQDAAFVAAAPAAVNGHHDVHADADSTEAAGDAAVEAVELPTTLMTDEGEIEILYEEFPENFDEEEPTAASDSEIDAALDEALRD